MKRNPIPDDQVRWGTWNAAVDELDAQIRRASEAAAAVNAPRGAPAQLIGDLWFTAMDSASINRDGLKPLEPDLRRIDAATTMGDIIELVAMFHRRNVLMEGYLDETGPRTLFRERVGRDERDGRRMILAFGGGGISVGPPVYTATDARGTAVRDVYRRYLLQTFLRLGRDSTAARRSADAVFAFEKRLAAPGLSAVRGRIMSVRELAELTPAIDWRRYLHALGAPPVDSVNVRWPPFFQRLDTLAREVPIETWRDYLRYSLVRSNAVFLDDGAFHEFFSLDSIQTGVARPRPRWRRVVWYEKHWFLGQPLAQLMADQYFPASVKARYEALGEAVRNAYRDRIASATWLSESTRRAAELKLARLKITVGLPEHWLDVRSMPLRRDSYVLNMNRSAEWFTDQLMKRLARPVDPADPDLYYNVGGDAGYDIGANEVQITDPGTVSGVSNAALDDAILYGGTALGHEISHAFDSNGRFYDANGNKRNWWTSADSAAFEQRAQLLVNEYDSLPLPDGLHMNGRRALAENMADLVGARVALDAFKKTGEYRRNEIIGGFTPLQRFFLARAYTSACNERPNYRRAAAEGDYAFCRERVNGVLMNMPEFYQAFGVRPGDAMYRAENLRASIW